jgi:hypothetical protein
MVRKRIEGESIPYSLSEIIDTSDLLVIVF